MFPTATPESQGLPSTAVLALIDRLEKEGHDPHSLIVLRDGRELAAGWWAPYRRERVHRLYSLSKSFTSTAIGLAVHEGRLGVDDPVLGFFPDLAPESPSENLRAMRVKDLLTMTCGQDVDASGEFRKGSDWARAFLSAPVPHAPGTHFVYNSGATYILSAILARVTGEFLLDYLRPRLLDPLGVGPARWETDPEGIAIGGWGLYLTTDAIARFGQLLLQRGRWGEAQLIPEAWIDEATSKQVENAGHAFGNGDWASGYGYQFWRSRRGFRGDGAFGQFCVVVPERGLVVAITSATDEMQGLLDAVWTMLDALSEAPLPDDPDAAETLRSRLSNLAAPDFEGGWEERSDGLGPVPGPIALAGNRIVALESTESMILDGNRYVARGTWAPREGTLERVPPSGRATILPMGLLRHVNVLQGTDSHHGFSKGNTLPLVAMPFGMNHWSAQTSEGRWFFSPHDKTLQGVRCTHQPSPWMADYGHFTVMANTGPERHLSPGKRARAYRGEFHPYRFKAELLNDGTTIEMAPTVRGAVFRFRFPEGTMGRVIFEPCAGESSAEWLDEAGGVVGSVSGNSGGVPQGFAEHFIARFDRKPSRVSNFKGEELTESTADERLGFYAEFEGGGEVVVRITTSFISAKQAGFNQAIDNDDAAFEVVVAEAERTWEENLARIEIESDDEAQLQTFYSCLYRTQLFPRIWHESTPEGVKHRSPYDGEVHDGPLYTDNGFWDTYRTEYPLLALLQPDQLAEILQGWTNAYREGGWFPQWATPGYRACMVGTHIDAVMADGITRGVTDFEVDKALEGLLKHADTPGDPAGAWGRIGIEDYKRLGYVSTDHHESVARTLDYAYDDWCIAQIATGEDRERLLRRAGSYKNLYDPKVGFMRGRNADGSWLKPWDEFQWGSPYVEGGPWQSSWAVQHDAAGLIRLMGGETAFVAKLDRMLTTPPHFTTGAYGFEIHEMTEMAQADFGQYAHSNQPVHHVLYLYNAAGRPWRCQKEVRRVMDRMYTPQSLPGDEDNGEMCAWYVLSALGLFPLTPGSGQWTLGSPLFRRATVHLPNGRDLVIDAPENGPENVYVRSVSLNGERLDRLFLTHEEVAAGGTLRFEMSPTPDETVVPASGRPYSMTPYA